MRELMSANDGVMKNDGIWPVGGGDDGVQVKFQGYWVLCHQTTTEASQKLGSHTHRKSSMMPFEFAADMFKLLH